MHYQHFKARAEAVSAEVHRFPTKAEAFDFIVGTLRKEGIADQPRAYAVWADCPFLHGVDRGSLSAAMPGLHFELTRERCDQAKVGISQVDWAVAETGTLIQNCSDVEQRMTSTLPSIHMAIVETDRILPDAATLWTKLDPTTSEYIAMITGPSRTADIERVLTIGVSGPERVIIVAIDQLDEVQG